MKYFSIRICTFLVQKLSSAAAIAAAGKLTEKWRNFVNCLFLPIMLKK
jgi:hypothetical protein